MLRTSGPLAQTAVVALIVLAGCLPDPLSDATINERIEAAALADDCVAIAACVHGCKGDETCVNACRAEAGATALAGLDALLACEKTCSDNGAAGSSCAQDPGGSACRGDCQLGDCIKESLTCGGGGDDGTQACIDGDACLAGCNPGSGDTLSCIAACGRPLTTADRNALGKMRVCYTAAGEAAANKPEAQAIQDVITTCAGETAACYTSGVSGSQTCHQGLACIDQCASKGDVGACYADCTAALTVSSQADFVSFLYCADNLGDAGQFFQQCSWALLSCAAPTLTGKTCDALLPGYQACMSGEPAGQTLTCLGEALHQARPKHAQYFIDFNVCLADKCGDKCKPGGPTTVCQVCLKTLCQQAYNNCGFK